MRQGGIPGSGGTKPANFFKLAKKAGVKWAVMVRDPTHSWYHRGLQEGDAEGFNAIVNTLKVPSRPRAPLCPIRNRHARKASVRVPWLLPRRMRSACVCRRRSTWCSPEMW